MNENIEKYKLIRKRGQKSLRMHFRSDGTLVVSAPFAAPISMINAFVESHTDWIEKHRKCLAEQVPKISDSELECFSRERAAFWAAKTGKQLPEIKLSNAKGYWGICYPQKNTVRISRRCETLDYYQIDYVILHEICHLTYCNHSSDFWNLVAANMPDFKTVRKSIRT